MWESSGGNCLWASNGSDALWGSSWTSRWGSAELQRFGNVPARFQVRSDYSWKLWAPLPQQRHLQAEITSSRPRHADIITGLQKRGQRILWKFLFGFWIKDWKNRTEPSHESSKYDESFWRLLFLLQFVNPDKMNHREKGTGYGKTSGTIITNKAKHF